MDGAASPKAPSAFRTIGEVATELGLPQHILRYWETRFPQLRPLQRAGNRRYYRPADVDLLRRIDRLLNQQGYTIRGVRKLLDDGTSADDGAAATVMVAAPPGDRTSELRAVRDQLAAALAQDDGPAG